MFSHLNDLGNSDCLSQLRRKVLQFNAEHVSRMEQGKDARVETMWWKCRSGVEATSVGTSLLTKWVVEMPACPDQDHLLSSRKSGGLSLYQGCWGGQQVSKV
jgi:hypothetical protein